ncbi:MAG: FeoB-associated Cys-rich membrane protein [Flavobacteriaceae bacterium]
MNAPLQTVLVVLAALGAVAYLLRKFVLKSPAKKGNCASDCNCH